VQKGAFTMKSSTGVRNLQNNDIQSNRKR